MILGVKDKVVVILNNEEDLNKEIIIAEVVSCGQQVTEIETEQDVIFGKYAGQIFKDKRDGKIYIILSEDQILGIYE